MFPGSTRAIGGSLSYSNTPFTAAQSSARSVAGGGGGGGDGGGNGGGEGSGGIRGGRESCASDGLEGLELPRLGRTRAEMTATAVVSE
mmetsp:Transcript_7391/g.19705  ORF Transcript_7391/g.19705 Transcript_7391/m.19705 type:complete len:88 (+) Transcript_7391:1988-2251(+)